MKMEQLYQRLIEAVCSQPADERTPYAFEQRIMARLRALPTVDPARLWGRVLWRASIPFAALALALAVWTRVLAPAPPVDMRAEVGLSELDQIVLAPLAGLSEGEESW